jgi:ribosome-associated protein
MSVAQTKEVADLSTQNAMQIAVDAALDRKAEHLTVLDLSKVSDFTDLFFICSGTNERQVQAIAENVRDQLRSEGLRPLHMEGVNTGRWVLMDYGGDMVVHVFLDDTRSFYALERLWSDAPVVTGQFTGEGQEAGAESVS